MPSWSLRGAQPVTAVLPLALLVALLGSACAATGQPTGRPSAASPAGGASVAAGAACAPGADPAVATSYPGWPVAGSQKADFIPSLVSTELVVGQDRFLLQMVDPQNKPIASSDAKVQLQFFDLAHDPAKAVSDTAATFLPVGSGRGLYRASVTFSCAGDWGVLISTTLPGQPAKSARGVFQVRAAAHTPALGSRMPPLDTPTAASAEEIRRISTDRTPDADFYRASVRQLLDAHKPFLLVFATPAFCKSATCGPTLDQVEEAAQPFKDRVAFVHVEPYQLRFDGTSLQPVLGGEPPDLQTIPIVEQLGLITEPFTFAVDRTGAIVAKFEGIVGRDELDEVLGALAR